MKVVALFPVKDEAWVLPAHLSSLAPVADEIIALDDGSTDGSAELIEAAGGLVVPNASPREGELWGDETTGGRSRHVSAWQQLLELGRDRGGTHFICLDADEALTAPCRQYLRTALGDLEPGQKLALRWLALWKRRDDHRDDGVWEAWDVDVAFVDQPAPGKEYSYSSVTRTPGPPTTEAWVHLSPERGAVLHYQFVPWWRSQVKHAWYRCGELIRDPRPASAYDINRFYSIGIDTPGVQTSKVPSAWLDGIEVPEGIEDTPPGWHLDAILAWFEEHGVEFFEPVQIWHIPQLHRRFVDSVGREPRPLLRLGRGQWIVKAIRDQLTARRA